MKKGKKKGKGEKKSYLLFSLVKKKEGNSSEASPQTIRAQPKIMLRRGKKEHSISSGKRKRRIRA